ncbi:hypothetical protein Y136_15180 [Listeria monocytogenes]|nr:hypothetical protein [Listeria monocytogenes]EAE0903891.1 hypothetical protein [Listeria monocytogenes]MCM65027.1 hypothetical protein [Listeria monocytogenes]OFH38861.1 hypothetical protein BJM84_04135 [Listeria monocytogenes]
MNYKSLIGYTIFYIVLLSSVMLYTKTFNFFVLIVGTICYISAIFPLSKKKKEETKKGRDVNF